MAHVTSPAAPQQDIDARLASLVENQKSLLADLNELRGPVAHGQAARTIKSFSHAAQRGPMGEHWKGFGDFLKSVRAVGGEFHSPNQLQHGHERMRDYVVKTNDYYKKALPTGMNELAIADGGVLVPPQYTQQILQRAYENDLLQRTTLMPMGGPILRIPAVNETSRADGSRFGGIQAYWRGEGVAADESKPGLHEIELKLESLMLRVKVTNELLTDSGPALETFIGSIAAQEVSFKIGDAIVNGDGNTKPLGFIGCPAVVSVAKETGQAAATFKFENAIKMWSRMWIGSRPNAVWLINQDVEPQLLSMTLGVGTGGVATYMPPGGLSDKPYGTLLGRPVITTEFQPTLGTQGDVALVDLSQYLTGTGGAMETATSMHVYFSTNEMAYRFIFRIDGKPWWLSPLTPFKGTATKSPFVVLDTRS